MKHLLYKLCTISLLLAFSTGVFAQTTPQERLIARKKGTTPYAYGYYEYLPSNYSSVSKHPVVIFFHGIKEAGNGTTEISRVLAQGVPKMIKYGKDFPFIMIAPQHTSGWWSPTTIDALIDYIVSRYKVDPYRIYVTGLSAGGSGTWVAGQSASDKVAAIVPICGSGSASQAYNMKNMGVWAFHNDKDTVIPASSSINMVNAVNKAGGHAKITLYGSYSHDAWTRTYNDQNMWNWLLSQRRGSAPTTTTNKLPVANAGSDKIITLPTNSISITSTASDPDGTISSRTWTKVSGPSASLSYTTSATLKVANMVAGTYVFRITVKDDKGATDYDDVKVTVNSSTTTAPTGTLIVNTGADKTITLPTNKATMSATISGSKGYVTYTLWTKVSGPSVTMSNYNQKTMYLSNLVAGTYVFRLTVKDNLKATGYDEVKVIVQSSSTAPIMDSGSLTVNTGSDKTITLPTNKATMTATISGSKGYVTYTLWTKISGPSCTMTNYNQKTMYLSNLVAGTYVFRLTVKDNLKATGYDEVKVIVKSSTARLGDMELAASPEIKLYPNPAVNMFKLELDAEDETSAQVLVISANDGSVVHNQEMTIGRFNTPEVNVANLSPGVYFVKVIRNGEEKTLRFVKQ